MTQHGPMQRRLYQTDSVHGLLHYRCRRALWTHTQAGPNQPLQNIP